MAIRRLIHATEPRGPAFVRRGSGEQRREFTYVADVVAATLAAGRSPNAAGCTLDVGGGASTSLNEVIALVEEGTRRPVRLEVEPSASGDPHTTVADNDTTSRVLGWRPRWSLVDGITAQIAWQAQRAAPTEGMALAG